MTKFCVFNALKIEVFGFLKNIILILNF